jgi:tetratricopeptide (TPR) repeat protein
MTSEIPLNRPRGFVPGVLPWVAAAVMLVVYLFTMGRGVSQGNLAQVVELGGWNWEPNLYQGGLTYLVTCPFRWLPPSILSVAVNVFAAVCGALTLALLARSVALLPHDRTQEQRDRESSDMSLLSLRSAWMPPVFAVFVCGLSLTFWQHAVESISEMVDLLLFAYLIRCLLEYRLDQRDSWLNCFALVFGMALANDWAMVAFIPLFLTAVIWIKGLAFFNLPFLVRSFGYWAAGLMLFLVLPLASTLSHTGHLTFWGGLHMTYYIYKAYLGSVPREVILLVSLTSVLPVFVIGIRWPSSFGDTSPVGIFLATSLFHVVHAVLLVACLWVALDSPLSPRDKGLGYPYLPLYYLGALSVGYFAGYFLLVFGGRWPRYRKPPPLVLRVVDRCVVFCVWALLLVMPWLLVSKNLRWVRAHADEPLRGYARLVEKTLPPDGAVILADLNQESRTQDDYDTFQYLQAVLNEEGRAQRYLLIDTRSLPDPGYIQFLDQRHPALQIIAPLTNKAGAYGSVAAQFNLLGVLARGHPLYYLEPAIGSYFERYYLEPHGLIYAFKPIPTNAPDAPMPTDEQIQENDAIWKEARADAFPRMTAAASRRNFDADADLAQQILVRLHVKDEVDSNARRVGRLYARRLDMWGVELQRCNLLERSGELFDEALRLNPDNVSAKINRDFNLLAQAGKKPLPLTAKDVFDKFGVHRNWTELLAEDGPVDEPNFCYLLATIYLTSGAYHEAIAQFQRVLALAPDMSPSRHFLAQLYLWTQNYTNAMEMSDRILKIDPTETHALLFKGAALMSLQQYTEAVVPLTELISIQTNNYAAQLNRAICYLQSGDLTAARADFQVVAGNVPKAYQADYGLGEIAFRQKDTNAAIQYYQLYAKIAPTNTAEARMIDARLKDLEHAAH